MFLSRLTLTAALTALLMIMAFDTLPRAQAGRGLLDPNIVGEQELLALPHMTAPIVERMLQKRPFMTVVDLHAFLVAKRLTQEQAADFYRQAFVQINLNTAQSRDQFEKEIGKYVGTKEAARLWRYVVI
jgi:hypothetical protein